MTKITLCGSTKFKEQFLSKEKELTLQGHSVYSCGAWGHSGDSITDEQKALLDAVHLEKILASEKIYVINPGGYIGPSTLREIFFAKTIGRKIEFMCPYEGFAKAFRY